MDQSSDDPDIVLARGVANTLAEDFPRALKDLERAKRLGLRGREPELWIYVTEAMSVMRSEVPLVAMHRWSSVFQDTWPKAGTITAATMARSSCTGLGWSIRSIVCPNDLEE